MARVLAPLLRTVGGGLGGSLLLCQSPTPSCDAAQDAQLRQSRATTQSAISAVGSKHLIGYIWVRATGGRARTHGSDYRGSPADPTIFATRAHAGVWRFGHRHDPCHVHAEWCSQRARAEVRWSVLWRQVLLLISCSRGRPRPPAPPCPLTGAARLPRRKRSWPRTRRCGPLRGARCTPPGPSSSARAACSASP